ncbi:hypothetical protein GIB67_039448 [Kingdonia uniflora]|uniref:K+ potassium transporter integral membrane domain-containing protein n=1 Tax=Kingdonia uniflora TaxID=39325 RepID=A0A7J7LIY7_9MAGN|nr:hypothetical protein GIB67_039448 [Kingdonia uniflora]
MPIAAMVGRNLILAYQSLGVVYGDLSTSPLYVYKSTFVGKLQHYQNEEAIFGAFSLIFWTLTLMPLLKYVIIVLSEDDNGEAAEELSTYNYGPSSLAIIASSPLKRFLDEHKKLRTALLVVVLFAACMLIGDSVLTPAISGVVTSLACIILVGLFAIAVWLNVFQALDNKVTELCARGIIGCASHLWIPYFLKAYNGLVALPILGSVKLMV